MTQATKPAPTTPRMTKEDRRLEQQSWHRDLYGEVCEEQGFVPAGLPAGVRALPQLVWARTRTATADTALVANLRWML